MPLTDKGRTLYAAALDEYHAIAGLLRQAEQRLERLDARLDGWNLNRNRRTGAKISEAETACRAMADGMLRQLEDDAGAEPDDA